MPRRTGHGRRCCALPACPPRRSRRRAGWSDGGVPAAPGDALAAADARFRLFDAVARSLAGLAAAPGRPLVVVLDDLHWADEPSLALLSFVSRALATSPVLTVGAYRDDEAPSPLQELACRALHVPLLGLAPAEVEDMVEAVAGRRPAPSVTARIRQRSGGNPLFVAELTRLLQTQDPSEPPGHLPAGVIETVRRRLARLPTDCVRLLDWAAVAGRDIDVGLLVAGGAAEDEATALDTLLPARHAGVVTERETLQFTHDLYREAIIEGQRADTNTAINLALGRALASRSRPGGAARIAAHLLRGRPAGTAGRDRSLPAGGPARPPHASATTTPPPSTAGPSRSSTTTDARRGTILLELAAAHARPVRSIPHGAATGRPPTWPGASTTSRPSPTPRSACSPWDTGPGPRTPRSSTCSARRPSASTSPGTGRCCGRACSPRPPGPCGTARTPSPTPSWWSPPAGPWTSPSRRATPAALAAAELAVHDAMWAPGTAVARLRVIEGMLDAARAAADAGPHRAGPSAARHGPARARRSRRARRAPHLHHPRRHPRPRPGPVGRAHPAGDLRAAHRAGRGGGPARGAGARARAGHRRAGRDRVLLHPPLVTRRPRRPRSRRRRRPGHVRPAVAHVPAARGLASRRAR